MGRVKGQCSMGVVLGIVKMLGSVWCGLWNWCRIARQLLENAMSGDKNFVFRLPDDVKKALERYAEDNHMPLAQVIRLALREFLKREGV